MSNGGSQQSNLPPMRGVRQEPTAIGELRYGGLRQPDPVAAG